MAERGQTDPRMRERGLPSFAIGPWSGAASDLIPASPATTRGDLPRALRICRTRRRNRRYSVPTGSRTTALRSGVSGWRSMVYGVPCAAVPIQSACVASCSRWSSDSSLQRMSRARLLRCSEVDA